MTTMPVFRCCALLVSSLVSLVCVSAALAQTRLITEEEAKAPNQPVPTTRAITRGPGIRLLSAHEVRASGFPFKLTFEPRGGAHIQPESVRVEYLKQPVIDLTPRLAGARKGNAIELGSAEVPPGTHPLRVSVRDSEGREAQTVIQLHAK